MSQTSNKQTETRASVQKAWDQEAKIFIARAKQAISIVEQNRIPLCIVPELVESGMRLTEYYTFLQAMSEPKCSS